jgi:hypothetical protein
VRRLRFVVIALAIVIIAGFAVLGAQIWLMNARTDQLATKLNGIDASFGVKFEETNAKLDAANTKLDASPNGCRPSSKRSEPKSRHRPARSPKASPPFAAWRRLLPPRC